MKHEHEFKAQYGGQSACLMCGEYEMDVLKAKLARAVELLKLAKIDLRLLSSHYLVSDIEDFLAGLEPTRGGETP